MWRGTWRGTWGTRGVGKGNVGEPQEQLKVVIVVVIIVR